MAHAPPSPAEQAVVRHAISNGYLNPQQLRQALLLREQLKANNRPSELLPILGARFVRPEHLDDLRRVWQQAQGGAAGAGIAQIPDSLLRASGEMVMRPAEQDPQSVRFLLAQTLSGGEEEPPANSAFGRPIPATIDPEAGAPSNSAFGRPIPATIDPDQPTVMDMKSPLRGGGSDLVAPPAGSGSAFGAPPSSGSGSAFGLPPGSAFGSTPGARPASTGFGNAGPFGSGAAPFGSGAGPFGSGAGPTGPMGSGAGPFGSQPRGGPGGTAFGPPGSSPGAGRGAGPSGSAFGAGPSGSAWGRPGPTGTAPGGGSASAFGQPPPPPPAFGPHGTAFGPPSAPGANPVSGGFGSSPAGSAFGSAAPPKKVLLPEPAPVPGTIDDVGDSTPAVRRPTEDEDSDDEVDDDAPSPRGRRRGRGAPPPAGGISKGVFFAVAGGAFLIPVGIMVFVLSSASSERQKAISDARRTARGLVQKLGDEGEPGARAQSALLAIAAVQRWVDRDPEDTEAPETLAQGYLALARAHIGAERWPDADWALEQAQELRVETDKVSKVRGERDAAEAALKKSRRDRVVTLLEAVDEQRPRTPGEIDEIARELAEACDPETTPLLLERLELVTAALRTEEAKTYRSAQDAFDTDPKSPLPKLEDELKGLEERTLSTRSSATPPDMSTAATRLLKRETKVADREGRRAALRMEQLVARRQRRTLGHHGVVARIVCGALGRGEPAEEVAAALSRYLANCADPLTAVPAGLALARLERDERSRELLALAVERYGAHSPFSMQLARFAPMTVATGQGPSDPKALQRLGLLLRARGQPAKALGYYQRLMARQNKNAELLGQWAEAQVAQGNFTQEALTKCDKALALDSKCIVALYARGSVKLHQHDDDAAVKDLLAALELDNWNPVLLSRLGLARLEASDIAGALHDFERAIGLDPEWPEGWLGRARARLAKRDYEGAAADASQALNLGSVEALLIRGKARQGARYFEGALADLTNALVYAPRDPRLFGARGRVRLDMKQPDEALQDFAEAIKLAPAVPEYIDGKACCYELKKEDKKAIAEYSKALEREKHSALMWGARGRVRLNQGQFELALEDLNKAVELAPKEAVYYRHRGQAYMLKGYSTEALADLEKALEFDPDHADGYKFRGDLRNVGGDVKGAVEDYSKALEIDPHNPQTWESRGTLHLRQKDIPKALLDFDQALKVDPTYLNGYVSRANAHLTQENWNAAIADTSEAIKINSKFPDPYFFRAKAKALLKDSTFVADLNQFLKLAGRKHRYSKEAINVLRRMQKRREKGQ